jgi:hypothetical protein
MQPAATLSNRRGLRYQNLRFVTGLNIVRTLHHRNVTGFPFRESSFGVVAREINTQWNGISLPVQGQFPAVLRSAPDFMLLPGDGYSAGVAATAFPAMAQLPTKPLGSARSEKKRSDDRIR